MTSNGRNALSFPKIGRTSICSDLGDLKEGGMAFMAKEKLSVLLESSKE